MQEEEPYHGELHFGVDVATDVVKQGESESEVGHGSVTEEQRRSGNPPDLIPTNKEDGAPPEDSQEKSNKEYMELGDTASAEQEYTKLASP